MNYALTLEHISQIHHTTQSAAARAINHLLTLRNWLVGAYLVEYEQNGEDRAAYGEKLLKAMSAEAVLTESLTPLSFPSLAARHIQQPALPWQDSDYFARLFRALSWSQLLELARLDDPLKRAFYELECVKSRWSLREMKRQMDSLLYERIGLSKDKNAVMKLAEEGRLIEGTNRMDGGGVGAGVD